MAVIKKIKERLDWCFVPGDKNSLAAEAQHRLILLNNAIFWPFHKQYNRGQPKRLIYPFTVRVVRCVKTGSGRHNKNPLIRFPSNLFVSHSPHLKKQMPTNFHLNIVGCGKTNNGCEAVANVAPIWCLVGASYRQPSRDMHNIQHHNQIPSSAKNGQVRNLSRTAGWRRRSATTRIDH